MPCTVSVNFLTVVHKASGGVSPAFPDVCKTPSPAGPIPIPYPNIAMSSDTSEGSSSVKADGNPIMLKSSSFSMSTGDEAGSAQGVVSNKIKGKACPLLYSFDVKVDGENVFRMTDMMLQNSGSPANTPPAPEVQAPAPVIDVPEVDLTQDPELVSVEWDETDKFCGDEVELEVSVNNYPAGTPLVVGVRGASGRRQLLSVFTGEVNGDTARGRWLTRTGSGPINPTPVTLQAFGLGDSVASTQSLDIEVPDEVLQAGTKLNRTVPKVIPQLQLDGSYNYTADPAGGRWGWDYGHELEIVDGVFKVTCKIKLVAHGGASVGRKSKRAWKREIEAIWNGHWREHRVNCGRGAACDCPGGCCLFPVVVVCEFVSSGEYCTVDVWGGSPNDYLQADGSLGRWWNSATWFMALSGREGNGAGVRAHEFGHAMGLYDEYRTGAVFVPTDGAGAVSGQPPHPDVAGSLMGPNGTDINANHLDEFHDWFVDQVPDDYHREPLP